MSFPFEAKYIQIHYINKKVIGSIKESKYPLAIDREEGSNEFSIEATTYSKLDTGQSGQLAFKLKDKNIKGPLHFILGGTTEELIRVKDPGSGHTWWVENGQWKKYRSSERKIIYRDSVICRTVGECKIRLGSNVCLIKISSLSFSVNQLNTYLAGFKDSLSELIWDDSYVTASLPGQDIKIANKNLIDLLTQFVKFIEKIVERPKRELREQQEKKNYKKVRPVSKTFMEIATKGFSKELTSRGYIESFNVTENRYIYSIVNKVYIQIKALNRITDNRIRSLEKEAKEGTKRLKESSDYIEINQKSCVSHLNGLNSDLEKENKRVNKLKFDASPGYIKESNSTLTNLTTLYISAESDPQNDKYGKTRYISAESDPQNDKYEKTSFYSKVKVKQSDDWYSLGTGNSLICKFRKDFFLSNNFVIHKEIDYKVVAIVTKDSFLKKKGGVLYIRQFDDIYKINAITITEPRNFYFQVTSSPEIKNGLISFYGKAKQRLEDEWFERNRNKFLFKFDQNIFSDFFTLNKQGNVYKIEGNTFKIDRFQSKKKNNINTRFFNQVRSLSIVFSVIQSDIKKYTSEIKLLKQNNWKRKSTPTEIKEQNAEQQSVNKTVQIINKLTKENKEVYKGFAHLLPRLKKLTSFFKKNKVRKDHHFPGSMTFIQNPHYLGAHNIYKKINEASGIDEEIFDLWQENEDVGILDVPALYERWCLLQIIKILIDKYKFIPDSSNWKNSLLMQIVRSKYNIELDFRNEKTGTTLRLTYEKEMECINRRPDFVLDFQLIREPKNIHRLIMDAKFRERSKFPGKISDLMYELYIDKKYSEGGKNAVYILHPSINAIKKVKNPQLWGQNSFYGEDLVNMDDQNRPKHQYGAILLSPFQKGYISYLDDLQRLIGMYLQYNTDENKLSVHDDILESHPKGEIFCLACGSDNTSKKGLIAGYNGKKYSCTCNDCHHFFIISYCGGCHNRLWKQGRYWTYHKTHAFEPYNIQCPSCGEIIAQRKE